MKEKISNFVTLDFGSSKIAVIAAYISKKGEIKVAGQNLHHSKGIKSGVILDLKNAETSILTAIYALEKDCGKNIKKVILSLSGAETKSYYINYTIKINGQTVTQQDIKKLLQKALVEFKFKNQEIIHYFPLEFTLDNNSVENPIGMYGRALSCELHIIAASSNLLSNIVQCFAKCHVEVTNITLAIYASAISCLTNDEKNLGALIIDMGDKTTSCGIFFADKLIYTWYLNIGSFHISLDIAKVFGIDFVTAEKLKILYGNAIIPLFEKDSIINIDDFQVDTPNNLNISLTIYRLAEVISARAEEILSMVKAEYDKATKGQLEVFRVVITGGGSQLRGLKELSNKIFEKQIRIGKPEIIAGFTEDYNPAMYSAAIGMLKIHALKQQKALSHIRLDENINFFKKAFDWFKENV
ncbi:cell division protein FtsA [Rickettsia typhi]|uniref:Cell division protein FtsA n=2 Tax=Rickettsia typhi TaxID=785 RepID=Q68XB8_RICTY|nr:cell division protein FtsA [Rickettsia typhi]AAU03724.1 cell division protein FtsA [Rickettsia typhi str. Wilmington]AFE54101.1 cell division protein FtsA [Rickettsia typhi str. TH1527]AFE54940.1 cell division protein FtsA [Rickettsia typhi str. B9991CWPP]